MKRIAVISTKGGVGKSTISVAISKSLAGAGNKVALIDADVTNPNIPVITGTERGLTDLELTDDGIVPVELDVEGSGTLKMFSVGYIMPSDQSIIWDGKEAAESIMDMEGSVLWGDIDFLIYDMPPQTSNIAKYVLSKFSKSDRVVVVTTAQKPAVEGAARTIDAVTHLVGKERIAGIIINMSKFICPKCGKETRYGLTNKEIKSMLNTKIIATLPLILSGKEIKIEYNALKKHLRGGIV